MELKPVTSRKKQSFPWIKSKWSSRKKKALYIRTSIIMWKTSSLPRKLILVLFSNNGQGPVRNIRDVSGISYVIAPTVTPLPREPASKLVYNTYKSKIQNTKIQNTKIPKIPKTKKPKNLFIFRYGCFLKLSYLYTYRTKI